MSNIGQFLEHIKHAHFGKDVRQSFVDCIEEIDRVADTAQDSATAAAAAAAESAASIAGVEERVKESENNTAESAAAAAESEANALASEVSASTSERNVAEMQAKVKASEQAALEASANALASEQASKASEQAAAESEANALASEQASKASEQAAAESEANALNYRDYAKSYTLGTNGAVRPGDDTDNASYFYEQAKRISQGLQGALMPMGTITFAQLPSVAAQSGYMYNISDDFVTDANFNEGAGHEYPAGTNVYLTADGKWDCMAGTAVGGVKGAKEATYRQGLVNLTSGNIGALPEDGDSAENTVSFSSADAAEANVWTDVDVLAGGEKHKSIFNKVSTMFKNIRYLYKMLGTTDISAIGGGTVTGAIAAQNEALITNNYSIINNTATTLIDRECSVNGNGQVNIDAYVVYTASDGGEFIPISIPLQCRPKTTKYFSTNANLRGTNTIYPITGYVDAGGGVRFTSANAGNIGVFLNISFNKKF